MEDRVPSQRCVLLVDDDEIIQTVMRQVIESFGCCVISAWNGQEGLEEFKNHMGDIHAIITDARMPLMNGISMISKIRELDNHILIAIMSTHTNVDIKTMSEQLGIRYFGKPPRIEALHSFLLGTPLQG